MIIKPFLKYFLLASFTLIFVLFFGFYGKNIFERSTKDELLKKIVIPPHSIVEGASIGEWGNRFWIWLFSAPKNANPAADETGAFCHIGQSGSVWFLAGSYEPYPVLRECNIPEGKYLYVPLYIGLVRPSGLNPNKDCLYSQKKVALGVDAVTGPYFILNGIEQQNIKNHREASANCFDASGYGENISAADAYAVMLKPLPKGRYVLRFGNNEAGPDAEIITTIINIVPAKQN